MSDNPTPLIPARHERGRRRTMAVTAIVAVAAAAIGVVVVTGSQPANAPRKGVTVAGHVLVTDGAYECQGIQSFDLSVDGSTRPFICIDRLLLASDGVHAAARFGGGLGLIDLRSGARAPMAGTEGAATPIAWSPDGSRLQWATCPPGGIATCRVFVGPLDDPKRNGLPSPEGGGYWGPSGWSADSRRFVAPTGDGPFLIGDGDGSRLVKVSVTDEFPLLAPDGSRFAYTEGRAANGNTVASDVFVVATDGGAPRRVTSFPDGTSARTVAWSPVGRTVAVVSETRPAPWIRPAVQPSVDLWLIGDGGQALRIPLPFAVVAGGRRSGEYRLLWSPDGARLIVGADVMHMEGEPAPNVDPLLVDPGTGGVAVLPDVRNPTWSPDGGLIAAVGGATAGVPTLDVMDRDGAGRRSLGRVSLGDWTQIVWAP